MQVPEHFTRQEADNLAANKQLAGLFEILGGTILLGGGIVESFDHPVIGAIMSFSASALCFRGSWNTSRAKAISNAYQLEN